MPANVKSPTAAELKEFLGAAGDLWAGLVGAVGEMFAPLDMQWRPSKAEFGRICLLRHRKRTLLYLTPDRGRVWVAIVLGERAFGLAMASPIPDAVKRMLAEARPYAEGRGIRYPVDSPGEIPVVAELLRIKTAPK
jgi:hypothetical protein